MSAQTTFMEIMVSASAFTTSGLREDGSGFFQCIFFGYCALIVIEQVIPAMQVLFGDQCELSL